MSSFHSLPFLGRLFFFFRALFCAPPWLLSVRPVILFSLASSSDPPSSTHPFQPAGHPRQGEKEEGIFHVNGGDKTREKRWCCGMYSKEEEEVAHTHTSTAAFQKGRRWEAACSSSSIVCVWRFFFLHTPAASNICFLSRQRPSPPPPPPLLLHAHTHNKKERKREPLLFILLIFSSLPLRRQQQCMHVGSQKFPLLAKREG